MAGLDPATQPGAPLHLMGGFVYIMASKRYGTIYVGVTSDLMQRAYQHREGLVPGFTKTYGVRDLVYYERHERIEAAIQREHNIKHWPRRWKTELIDGFNPQWDDLYPTLM
jgi:putative endonuclease